MNDYEIILFDLDGTLTDPKLGITKSVQYALEKFNIIEPDLDKLESFIGPPLISSFKEFYSFDEEQAIEAVTYYREYFKKNGIFENKIYDGIEELLSELKTKNKKLIIATSKPTFFAEKIISHFNLDKYFDDIVGSNLDNTRSDKTDIIEYILERLEGIERNKIIMIGDRKHDIIGAKNNNLDSIGVRYGYGSKEELRDVNPTIIVKSVKELAKILR